MHIYYILYYYVQKYKKKNTYTKNSELLGFEKCCIHVSILYLLQYSYSYRCSKYELYCLEILCIIDIKNQLKENVHIFHASLTLVLSFIALFVFPLYSDVCLFGLLTED